MYQSDSSTVSLGLIIGPIPFFSNRFYHDWRLPRGGRNIFSRSMPKPPGFLGDRPTTPHTTRKDSFNFVAKIQLYGAKIQIYGDKYILPKLKYVAPKFRYSTPNSIDEFLYHQKPPALYEENSRRRRIDTHPPPHRC